MSEATLEATGLEAILDRRHRVRVPNLRVAPGEVVAIPTAAALATGLAELLAGHGFGWIAAGELRLNNQDMSRMSPESRQHSGLFVPQHYARAAAEAEAFREMLAEVNRTRKIYSLPPVPTLTALIATGMNQTFGGRTAEVSRIGGDIQSLLFQALLTGAPLAVVPLPEDLPQGLEGLLRAVVAEAQRGGRGLLLIGELPATLASLPGFRVTAPLQVEETPELAEAS